MNRAMSSPIIQTEDRRIFRSEKAAIGGVASAAHGGPIVPHTREGHEQSFGTSLGDHCWTTPHQRRPLLVPPIHERLNLLSQAVQMVAQKILPSLILVGPPGLGKSYEVTGTLHALGLERDHDYFLLKGYASARGLYESLYRHNDCVLVCDDCDNALTDPVAVELLKGALDSYDVRTIAWLSAAKRGGAIPPRFDFTGAVIFISNRLLVEIDEPIRNRSLVIDLQMSRAEMLERMETLLPRFEPKATAEQRRLAMNFVRHWAPNIQQLSLRTLRAVLRIIQANPRGWEQLAVYATTR